MGFSGITSNHEEASVDCLKVHQTRQRLNSNVSQSEIQSERQSRQNGSHLGRKRNRSQLDHSNDQGKSDNDASAVSGRLRQRATEDAMGANKRQHSQW